MPITIANARKPVVRVKATWAAAWTTLTRGSYEIGRVKKGSNSTFGGTTLTVYRTAEANREEDAPAEPTIAADYFVQVGAEDVELPESSADRIHWLWLGVVSRVAYVHDGYEVQGSEQSLIVRITYQLEGMAALFGGIYVGRTRIRAHDGTSVELQRALPFNRDGKPDRNEDAEGDGTYAHRLDYDADCRRWTAREVLKRILADHINATRTPTFPTFTLAGQLELLDYVDEWDLAGKPLDQVLTELAGGRRGGNWTVEPTDAGTGAVTIRITSGLRSAIPIPGYDDVGAVTLPACDRQIDLLDTADSHWGVQSDIYERPRRWIIEGTARTTLTLSFKAATPTAYDGLGRGWPSANDAQAGSADRKYLDVFRRYVLLGTWQGMVAADDGLARSAGRSTQAYTGGAEGYDGTLTFTESKFPVAACRLDADLVVSEVAQTAAGAIQSLASWATDATGVIPKNAPRDQARVYIDSGTSTATEITEQADLKITNDPVPTVLLGRDASDGLALRTAIGSNRLAVTCTVVEPIPVLVSREPAGATVEIRVRSRHEVHFVAKNTWLAPDCKTTARKVVRDDRPQMRALLAALGPYLDRAGAASIVNRLELLTADSEIVPGALVVAYHDGREDQAIPLNAVVASVTWDFAEGSYGTYIELEPPTMDLRAYL